MWRYKVRISIVEEEWDESGTCLRHKFLHPEDEEYKFDSLVDARRCWAAVVACARLLLEYLDIDVKI